ncbi:YlmC/YmxH family sporulation protein [Haloimpatiens sp. FM7330]|uniref:YlmC/YmxH family sporulation protein n=1 Tax=Haloimpatiens sp. FM7330 TaxID=3298610 RepID=UPI0036349D1D
MDDKIKLYSDMERFEIININDGDKHGCLCDNDIVVDEYGELQLLILNESKSRFSIFSNSTFSEVPWDFVKKIGSRTIIIDVDENTIKKTHI